MSKKKDIEDIKKITSKSKWSEGTVTKGAILKFSIKTIAIIVIVLGLFFGGYVLGQHDTTQYYCNLHENAAQLIKDLKSQN